MRQVKITDLPPADTLTGDELTVVVQSGVSKKASIQEIVDNASSDVEYWAIVSQSAATLSSNSASSASASAQLATTKAGESYNSAVSAGSYSSSANASANLASGFANSAAASAALAASASRLTVGTVSTGTPGSSATVAITGPAGSQIIDFSIPAGYDGVGVASGGTTGQVLKKQSNSNYDTFWADGSGGISSVSGTLPISVANGTTSPVVSISQANASTNGYLSSSDWSTFNNKQPSGSYLTSISVASNNGFSGSSSGGITPSLTIATSVTGLLKGNGTAISAASSGTDYAPATSGTSILYGNGSGGFSNVTIGSGVSFAGGTLSATGSGGTVTSVSGTAPIASTGGATPAISISQATTSTNGYLSSTDWNTFNNKQPAGSYQSTLVSGTNIKSVNSTSLLGSGDLALFAGGLIQVKVVATLPGSPDANTLYIVTT